MRPKLREPSPNEIVLNISAMETGPKITNNNAGFTERFRPARESNDSIAKITWHGCCE